ncbi:carbohydrate binding domain-containing protein [Mongoliitalea daihaiensis]|uniref:carbohydrate binding domain-containing protein n=1 Tax=Mongoliitalea daihaiensis TaxID=2782006 RepID=UPI001F1648B5|nr:carbohydrate binding domain-containing protein [Mongoliitalea daihaiensis]UJP66603.1 carbohydrate binding domain-containing protein [Mongoliitalea daihaiensis]
MKNFTLFLTTFLMAFVSFHAWSLEIPPKALEIKSAEDGPNILINGDFSSGLNSWSTFIADFAGVSATVAVTDGEAAITNITGGGGEVWHVQLNQLLTPAQIGSLQVGETYKASFQARSTAAGRQLRMYFGEDGGGFQSINVTDVTLGTEMQTFEATFVVGATFGAMKLGFEMGLSNDPVFIDNVSLAKTEASDDPPVTGGAFNLPVTFDDEDIDYVLADFGGAISEIVTDPTDANNRVVQTIKPVDAADFAGTTVGGTAGFSSPIPFAPGATTMSVRVWSPVAGIPVRLKVEASNDPTITVETEARVTQAETWQTLVFDFSNEAFGTAELNFSRSYNMASIFFDFLTSGESVGAARTYFWDDMEFGGEVGEDSGSILLPITFENDIDWSTVIENFAGGELTVIDNPDTNGNESARVGRMVKNTGEVFGGSFIRLDQTIDLSKGTEFKALVWAPRANTTMLLKFENPLNPAQEFEQSATIPVANEWVEVSFDMSGANRAFTFRNVVLIFDLGTVGDGSENFTWFVDNISQVEEEVVAPADRPTLPLTFEEDINWEAVITNFDGGVLTVIDNPDTNGNTSAKVAQMVKNAGQPWGGAVIDLAGPIDLSKGTEFTAQVWAPRENTTMLFKFENSADPGQNFEQNVTIPAANQWTDVTINMSGANRAFPYDRIVFIFDLGTVGDGSANFTWFLDNVVQVEGEGPGVATLTLPVTFDDEELDYALTDFGGTASEIVVDPTNPANRVAQTTKTENAETFAGTTIGGTAGFVSPIPFAAGATFMNARVWSPVAGIQVRLKVEAANDPTVSVETEATVTRASGWQTLTFNFANQATGTEAINFARTYNKATIFFDFGRTGAQAGGARTYFWDDVAFGVGEDEDPGIPTDGPVLPLTFEEDIDWDAVITGFDGGELTVIDNPDTNGNPSARVARMVKNAGQPWGGAFIDLAAPLNLSQGAEFTAQVWAPRANTTMLFKLENSANPDQNFEQSVTIPTASAWTNVSFDMSGANPSFNYDRVVLIFDLGTPGDGSANFTWFVDNIRQVGDESEPEVPTSLIINGNFADGLNSWTPFIADFAGVSANVAVTNGEAAITNIVGAGGEIWHVQLNQIFTQEQIALLEVGETYKVSFQARSTVEGRQLRMYFGEDGGGFRSIEVTDVSLGTEMQTFEVTFEVGATYDAMKLGFEMGLSNDPVFIDNVSMMKEEGETSEPETPTSLVINGDFADDLNSWTPFIADFAGVSANVAVTNGEAAITNITGAGGEIWHVQLNQIFTPEQIALLEVGETYKVSFQARSTVEGRQLRMYFGEDGGGFRSIEVTDVSLGTEMQTFEVTFEVGATYDAMKLGFEMGLSNDPVFIDNVSMVKVVFELSAQSITFVDIPAQLAGGDPIELEATASSGLAVSFTAESENISIEGNVVTLLAAGRATIVATQEGNNEFRPAAPVTRSFCINPLKPTISLSGEGTGNATLTSSASMGNQWFRNGIAIEGATGQTFTVTNQGSYTVAVRVDDCVSEVSDAINLIVNSNRIQQPRELSVFPNPVENYLQIRGVSGPVRSIEMIDMAGRVNNVVFEESNDGIRANVSHLTPGMYVVRIQEMNRSYAVKVMKK